jgi:hypothetical protein
MTDAGRSEHHGDKLSFLMTLDVWDDNWKRQD